MRAIFIAVAVWSLCATTIIPVHAGTIPTPSQQIRTVNNKIDLNKADLSVLAGSFKGIGKKRAEAIIAYRESHQGFKSIEELADIKGLGQHFVTANRDKLNEVFVIH